MAKNLFLISMLFALSSCNSTNKKKAVDESKAESVKIINHSYSNINDIYTTHLYLNLEVDFKSKTIKGVARHKMNNTGVKRAIFDIKDVEIEKVTTGEKDNEKETTFKIGGFDSLFGSPLIVDISDKDSLINIYYSTTENAEALGWMDSELTESKNHPFLYTQGEAILTRSWIPIQDVPKNRFTYSADIKVPNDLLVVMSATNPQQKNELGEYHFEMKQPISCYLLALAVGDLEYVKLNERCGVYAEPSIVHLAAKEFESVPRMIDAAEKLYGKYPWEMYDVLVLPYSFPFGGMENPRLTFLTPTLIAGDGSLVTVIAHELAHSWSGNLVTNATWDDFWLNEGFTVYFENRIMEEVEGKETAEMLSLIDLQELEATIKKMMAAGEEKDTHLKLDLEDRNPDDGMTDVAYIKGAFFLRTLEQKVGREKWDIFLRSYFKEYQFHTITTEDFIDYLNKNLLQKENIEFNIDEWIYGSGIPSNIIKVESERFKIAENLATEIKQGESLPKNIKISDKTTQEWLAFIRAFDGELSIEKMEEIDEILNFKSCGNSEIMCEWYVLGIKNNYTEIHPEIEAFLVKVGRRKYLEPLYETLVYTSDETKKWGLEVYKKARPNYHSISYNTVDGIFGI